MSESDSRDSVGQSAECGETTTPGLDGDDVTKRIQVTGRVDDLRTRIAAALRNMKGDLTYEAMADAVIRELPELRRIAQVRKVCVAMLNADRVPGESLNDRAWLADTVLNVLNGEVDD